MVAVTIILSTLTGLGPLLALQNDGEMNDWNQSQGAFGVVSMEGSEVPTR